MQTPFHSKEETFTAVVRRPALKGSLTKIEAQLNALITTSDQFAGHLGGIILRHDTGQTSERVIVLRFRDKSAWRMWRDHPDTISRITALDDETGARGTPNYAEGIAGWFDLTGSTAFQAPPKWKMAIVTWITIFPLLLLITTMLRPVTSGLGPILGLAVGTAVTVPFMVWIAMPFTTKLLRKWLFLTK